MKLWKFLLLSLIGFVAVYATELLQYTTNDFTGGLNTKYSENLIGANQCADAENIFFDETLGFKTRFGSTAIAESPVAGKEILKSWQYKKTNGERYFIAQVEGSVYATADLENWTTIKTGLKWQLNSLQMAVFQDKAFFTNGIDSVFYWDGSGTADEISDLSSGKYIAVFNNKLFLANFYDNASRVQFSEDGEDAWLSASWKASSYEDAGYEDGDIITGLYPYKQFLLIFKERSIWAIVGYSWDSWSISKLTGEFGAVSQESIVEDKGTVKFLSADGLMEFDGASFRKIDYLVDDIFLDCDNLKGQVNYWQNTSDDDWASGTDENLDITEEIKLEELDKVWSSSDTYPTAFSSGTFSNIDNSSDDLVLHSTGTSFEEISVDIITDNTVKMVGSSGAWGWLYDSRVGPFASNGDEYFLRNNVGNGEWWSLLGNAIDDDNTTGAYKMTGYDYVYPQVCFGGYTHKANLTQYKFRVNSYYNFSLMPSSIEKITKVSVKADIEYPSSIYFDIFYSSGTFDKEIYINTYLQATINFKDGGSSDYSKLIAQSHLDTLGTDWEQGLKRWSSSPTTVKRYYEGNTIELPVNRENEDVQSVEVRIMSQGSQTGTEWWRFYSLNQVKLLKLYEINLYAPLSKTIYDSAGTYTTEIHDFGKQVYLSTFTASVINDYEQNGTTITFKIKTSSWSATLAGETWTDLPNGTMPDSSLSPCRYAQILSSFSTTMSSYTPVLQSMELKAIASTGTWTSPEFHTNKIAGGWKYFIAMATVPTSTTATYSVRTATSSATLATASWDTVDSGELLDSGLHPSTHTYYQQKVYFTTTAGNKNPTVESLTQTYVPEQDVVIPAATSINNRYYIAISTDSSENNKLVMCYDKNNAWTKITGWDVNSFGDFSNDNYYVSDKIYKLDDTLSTDNGNSITSKYEKYFDFNIPYLDKHLRYVYLTGRKDEGTFELEYKTVGTTATYTMGDDTMPYEVDIDQSGTGIFSERIVIRPMPAVRGFYETITSTNPIEIHSITNFYEPEVLR